MPTDPDLPRRLRWAAGRVDTLADDPVWQPFSASIFTTFGTTTLVNINLDVNIWSGDAYEDHQKELHAAFALATAARQNLRQLAEDLRSHAEAVERQIAWERQRPTDPFSPWFP